MHSQYDVNNSGNFVYLSLKILYGQHGVSRLFIGQQQILVPGAEPPSGDFDNDIFILPLDTNKNLKGKSLAIFTTVHDISPSDKAAVQIYLEGGVKPVAFPPVIQPISNGGLAYFPFVINFY